MATISNIVIADGQSTPVNHTFTPMKTVPPTYRNKADTSVPTIGQEMILFSMKEGTGADGLNRLKVTLKVPSLENNSTGVDSSGYAAPPKVAYFIIASAEFILPLRSTAAQRKNARVLLASLMYNSQLTEAVEDFAIPY